MHLISLTSNKDSFHPVEFKSGVNLVVGLPTDLNKDDVKKTFNGVGKTFLIKLIDFCLACDSIPELEEKLEGWEFSLKFSIKGEEYVSKRTTKEQSKISLNGEEMTLNTFRVFITGKIFKLDEDVSYVTYRSLLSRFIRTKKESYISYDSVSTKETDYSILVNKAFLLGLDLDLINVKKGLRKEYDTVDKLRKNIEGDEIFKLFFTDGKDVEIELARLSEEISNIQDLLENYKVSEDYYQIQKEADEIKYETQLLKNSISSLLNSISNINKSLEIRGDVSAELVEKMYSEAKIKVPEMLKKTLNEVGTFHNSLFEKRKKRLVFERDDLIVQKDILEKKRKENGEKLDELLKFLGKHKALDEFVSVSKKLTALTNEASKLNNYKDILKKYIDKKSEIELQLKAEDIKANKYIDDIQELKIKNLNTFRDLAKVFYTDKSSGITFKNNTGANQIRFNIDAHIDDDTSDGVNEVKIFCYDLALLLTRHSHSMEFIIHDSRLFSNMDPRQRSSLFRLAQNYAKKMNLQYIATVNQDQLDPLKKYYSDAEYKEFITDNVVLELTDESDESRLLGVQVNIDYEK